MTKPTPSPSLFDLLDAIRKRPTMYIGFDDQHRREQIDGLEFIVTGYEAALQAHQISEPGDGFIRRFAEYLHAKYGWSMSCGPFAAIRLASKDDAAAWERLWILIDDFRAACEP